MKTCSQCHQEKPLSEFWKRCDSSDGLRYECKSCRRAKHGSWIARNSARKRQMDRAYYAENADAVNCRTRERYQRNRDVITAKNRKWRQENKDKVRESNHRKRQNRGDKLRADRRQHYRNNKPIYVANARKREKHITLAIPMWADLQKIEALYVQAAVISERTSIKHHVDHIYPLRSKIMCGLHVETNLQVIPADINLRKSNTIDVLPEMPYCCAWPSVIECSP